MIGDGIFDAFPMASGHWLAPPRSIDSEGDERNVGDWRRCAYENNDLLRI